MKHFFLSLLHRFWNIKFYLIYFLGGKNIDVRALVIKEDAVLLVKHTYAKGWWYAIGGSVERKEAPSEAIKRELMEEVGVKLEEAPQLFAIYHYTFKKRDDYVILYIVRSFTMFPANSLEIESSSWFKLHELPVDISPATRRRIEEFAGLREISNQW